MTDIRTNKLIKRKQESREIVKKIIDFGVTEDQKIDIMFNIALTLENNSAMKDITNHSASAQLCNTALALALPLSAFSLTSWN